jgi:cobalt-precorrin 5A hydrolase
MQVVLGLGCDRGTSLATLQAAIIFALQSVNLSLENVCALATIDKKSDEAAILELSQLQNWPLQFYSSEQLAQVAVPNPSTVVQKYMGTPSVSEAAALLAANTDMSQLLVEKYKYCGEDGKNATVSIVQMSESK